MLAGLTKERDDRNRESDPSSSSIRSSVGRKWRQVSGSLAVPSGTLGGSSVSSRAWKPAARLRSVSVPTFSLAGSEIALHPAAKFNVDVNVKSCLGREWSVVNTDRVIVRPSLP